MPSLISKIYHIIKQSSRDWPIRSILVIFVLLLATFLRGYQADRYPINNMDDGIFYVWAGTSFWKNPVAVRSLTLFDSENPNLIWRSQYLDYIPHQEFGYRIVQPWFDHPPLGTAYVGLPAFIFGYTHLEKVPEIIVRLPAILAGIATVYLTYKLFASLFNWKLGLFSSFVLATFPYFVFAHRQSYLENIMTPMMLISFWLGFEVIMAKSSSKLKWFFALLAAFATGWIKLVGLAVPLLLSGWAFNQKRTKIALIYGLIFVASISSYIGYSLIADTDGFMRTMASQSSRGMYWDNLADIVANRGLAGSFKDSGILLGWISTFIFLLMPSKNDNKDKLAHKYFGWIFGGWLVIVILTSGIYNNFIWYRYPLFPFLSFGIAWLFNRLWKSPNLVGSLLLLLLGWSQLDIFWPAVNLGNIARFIFIFFLAAPGLIFVLSVPEKWAQMINRSWLILLIVVITLTNALVVAKFPTYDCTTDHHCSLPTRIIVE